MLEGVLQGLLKEQTDENLKNTAIKALRDSLPFYIDNFKNKQIRNFVMNLLLINCVHDNFNIKKNSLECLIEVCSFHYAILGDYIKDIVQVSVNSMKDSRPEIAIPAIEIWIVIGSMDL